MLKSLIIRKYKSIFSRKFDCGQKLYELYEPNEPNELYGRKSLYEPNEVNEVNEVKCEPGVYELYPNCVMSNYYYYDNESLWSNDYYSEFYDDEECEWDKLALIISNF